MTDENNIPLSKRTVSNIECSGEYKNMIDSYIKDNKHLHYLAQDYGEFIINSKFSNTDTFSVNVKDKDGDEILCNKIINSINFYGLKVDELEEYEINSLINVYGVEWEEKIKSYLE